MKIGILLSGCGVYDGSEIQEVVLSMLAVKRLGHDYQCISIDKKQHHVINHTNGEEMEEERNMLVESARIARGEVVDISTVTPADIDAVIMPGGFGAAKNFTTWAFNGPDGEILPEVKLFLVNMINIGKPIAALCVSPVVLAKALEDSNVEANLTLGTTEADSPYDIDGFHQGLEQVGATTEKKAITEVLIDQENRIVTAPCYMMEANITEIADNIEQAVNALVDLCD